MTSLGEAFPIEQARVRELLVEYRRLGPTGVFGATMIDAALRRADAAVMSGDVVAMIRSFEELKACE